MWGAPPPTALKKLGKYFDHFYEEICHPLNLWQAYKSAARGKRYRPAAASFEYDLEKNLLGLEKELITELYQPGGYHSFRIQKPKKRLINAAPFRDRVVHHALMQIIEPFFERQFIYDSYANRKGKGTHAALDRCTHFMRRNKFVMHLDVCQYFPSIDHEILVSILARTIRDERTLRLTRKIIASGDGVQSGEYDMVYFPGDDLFARLRSRGLPIGNLTSQHWANVYLNELDQYAKRSLKCHAYLRYVDDMLVFADEKAQLHYWREQIIEYLETLRLKIHEESAQPRPSNIGVTFLGFQVCPGYRRLKPANGYAFQRRIKSLAHRYRSGQIPSEDIYNRVLGWVNHARYGDTWGLRQAILSQAGLLEEQYG